VSASLPSSASDRAAPFRRPPTLDRVTATVPLDPYLSLKALASYAGVSVRQLREYLVNPPLPRDAGIPIPPPMPHYRLGSRIVVRRSEFDRWMAAFRARPSEARAFADRLRAQAP